MRLAGKYHQIENKTQLISQPRYPAATVVHRACVNILRRLSTAEPGYKFVKLECLTKLLHSLSNYCQFTEAGNIYTELTSYVWDQDLTITNYPTLAYIYSECSSYHFAKVDCHPCVS